MKQENRDGKQTSDPQAIAWTTTTGPAEPGQLHEPMVIILGNQRRETHERKPPGDADATSYPWRILIGGGQVKTHHGKQRLTWEKNDTDKWNHKSPK